MNGLTPDENDIPLTGSTIVHTIPSPPEPYFVPSVEDVRAGYEFEVKIANINRDDFGKWVKYKEGQGYGEMQMHAILHHLREGGDGIRVPYLTKEQIEKEGWIKGEGQWWEWPKECENYWTREYKWRLNWGPGWEQENYRIFLEFYDNNWFEWFRAYEGPCKDINTLRYLMKLLNVK